MVIDIPTARGYTYILQTSLPRFQDFAASAEVNLEVQKGLRVSHFENLVFRHPFLSVVGGGEV